MRYGSAAAMVSLSSLDRPVPSKAEPDQPSTGIGKVSANPEVRVAASAVMAFDERKYAEVRGVEVVSVEGVEQQLWGCDEQLSVSDERHPFAPAPPVGGRVADDKLGA